MAQFKIDCHGMAEEIYRGYSSFKVKVTKKGDMRKVSIKAGERLQQEKATLGETVYQNGFRGH